VHALVLYFDMFFNPTGEPVPPETQPTVVRAGGGEVAEVWQMRRRPSRRASGSAKTTVHSFSTGPQSVPTHWKQTLFLLREPIAVDEGTCGFERPLVLCTDVMPGTIVSGSIRIHKSKENVRELDVEIQYAVRETADAPAAADVVVQIYMIR
jgi:protein arginine N-methyltransferase 3